MKHNFVPLIKSVGKLDYVPTVEELHNEPMLFGADWTFARDNAGPLTHMIMDQIKNDPEICAAGILKVLKVAGKSGTVIQDFHGHKLEAKEDTIIYNTIIDTRIHMLMNGMYPAIPGWHCDGVPRQEQYSQPDLSKIDPKVKFFTCLLSSNSNGCSATEFLDQEFETEIDEKAVWSSLDKSIDETPNRKTRQLTDGNIVMFDQNTPHRASPCHLPGWRLFFRLGLQPVLPQNKIRKQVQVYTVKGIGW